MTRKTIFIATIALLFLFSVATRATEHKNASPIYLYIHNPETGKCDIRDSDFLYKPVPAGTFNAIPMLASLEETSAQCDTIYVILNRK